MLSSPEETAIPEITEKKKTGSLAGAFDDFEIQEEQSPKEIIKTEETKEVEKTKEVDFSQSSDDDYEENSTLF